MPSMALVLGIVLVWLPCAGLADWQERYSLGERLLEEGRPDRAVVELSAALREAEAAQPGNAQIGVILDSLGRAEFRMGRYRSAKSYLERSMAALEGQVKEQAIAKANLAQACQSLGEFVRAEQLFRKALESLPESARLWQRLGQVLYLEQRFEESEAAQRRAISLAEKSEPGIAAVAWNDLAILLEEKKEYRKSAELLEHGIAIARPGQQRARMLSNLGSLQLRIGPKEEAVRSLADALAEMEAAVGRDHPDVGRILEQYAAALRGAGRKPEAKEVARRAESIRMSFSAQTNSERATVDWRELK